MARSPRTEPILHGSAVDVEMNHLSRLGIPVRWISGIGVPSRNLESRHYTITVQVTDSGGMTGKQSITVVVQAAPPVPNNPPVDDWPRPMARFEDGASSPHGSAVDAWGWESIL